MLTFLFAKSALLGLAIAAPLGPIGALCINRTLDRGFRAGVAGGLGTALADASYAALAAAGFAVFAAALAVISKPLAVGGGLFLLWLGWTFLRAGPPNRVATATRGDLIKTIVTTFLLTIANPATILSFAAIFAGLGLASTLDTTGAVIVVLGVFAGSMVWWIVLSGTVAIVRDKLPAAFATWVGRASGLLIIGFGLASLGSVFMGLAQAGF